MSKHIPVWRRLIYSLIVFVVFLGGLELLLKLGPRVVIWARGSMAELLAEDSVVVLCAGDSVTFGLNLDIQQSYPWRLADDLARRGYPHVSVQMAARPGSKTSQLRIEVLPFLDRLAPGQRPIVYVMLGHNDYFSWDPDLNEGAFDGVMAFGGEKIARDSRILKILSWASDSVTAQPTRLNMEPFLVEEQRELLRLTAARVHELDGELVVMTYVVPGLPPQDLPQLSAQLIRESHFGQPIINQQLRDTAAALGLPVLDLEAKVDTGAMWNSVWWLDNIHMSGTGLERVAAEVRAHLLDQGWLGAPQARSASAR